MKRLDILSVLFSSKETYLKKSAEKYNQREAFVQKKIPAEEFMRRTASDTAVILSGGSNEERAILLRNLADQAVQRGETVIILHTGNYYLEPEFFERVGMSARYWDKNFVEANSLPQMLALLANDHNAELASFWAWAYQVMEALNIPISLRKIAEIDWFDMKWQIDLLMLEDTERAMDLIARFNSEMSKMAAKATVQIEKIARAIHADNNGISLKEAMCHPQIVCAEMKGSQTDLTVKCLDAILSEVEYGEHCLLILDNIYTTHSVITDNIKNIRVVLSADDLCSYSENINGLTHRNQTFILLRHSSAGSAEMLSKQIFGQYDRVQVELTVGSHMNSRGLFSKDKNMGLSTHKDRSFRLDPLEIMRLPKGCALISCNGLEGIMRLESNVTENEW